MVVLKWEKDIIIGRCIVERGENRESGEGEKVMGGEESGVGRWRQKVYKYMRIYLWTI